jgi:flagellar hook-associated protein 3 FlgL
MITGLSASDLRFLAALNRISDRLTQAETEVTSGRRINTVSDHPDQISAVLTARANLDQTTQIQINLGRASTEVQTADQTITDAISVLDQVTTLAAQGVTETMSADQRNSIGHQIGDILNQLVSATNTQVEGRYIFSGDTDQVAPYSMEAAVAPATLDTVSFYTGADSTRKTMHPDGTQFSIALTAQQVFDAPGASVLNALTDLRNAFINSQNDPPNSTDYATQTSQIRDAMTELSAAKSHMNQSLAFYGSVENRITEATTYASKLLLNQKTQLSTLQDADITQSILDLNQTITQQQAALSARAKIPTKSLFDYMG